MLQRLHSSHAFSAGAASQVGDAGSKGNKKKTLKGHNDLRYNATKTSFLTCILEVIPFIPRHATKKFCNWFAIVENAKRP